MTLKYCVATDSDWSINLFNKSNYVAFVISPLLLSLRVAYKFWFIFVVLVLLLKLTFFQAPT